MPEYGLVGFLTPEEAKQSAVEHGYPDAEIISRPMYAWIYEEPE